MASNYNTNAPAGTTGTTTGYSTSGATTNPGTTAANTSGNNTGERVAEGIKGAFAQGHGIGESLRGNINSAIDSLTGDKAKQVHDEQVAKGGFREVDNKRFEKHGTTDKAL